MTRLSDVDRLVNIPEEGRRLIAVSLWIPARLKARWWDQMPTGSLSWFVRESMERFLEEMADLPQDTLERACKLIAADLAKKRTGPILRQRPRL